MYRELMPISRRTSPHTIFVVIPLAIVYSIAHDIRVQLGVCTSLLILIAVASSIRYLHSIALITVLICIPYIALTSIVQQLLFRSILLPYLVHNLVGLIFLTLLSIVIVSSLDVTRLIVILRRISMTLALVLILAYKYVQLVLSVTPDIVAVYLVNLSCSRIGRFMLLRLLMKALVLSLVIKCTEVSELLIVRLGSWRREQCILTTHTR